MLHASYPTGANMYWHMAPRIDPRVLSAFHGFVAAVELLHTTLKPEERAKLVRVVFQDPANDKLSKSLLKSKNFEYFGTLMMALRGSLSNYEYSTGSSAMSRLVQAWTQAIQNGDDPPVPRFLKWLNGILQSVKEELTYYKHPESKVTDNADAGPLGKWAFANDRAPGFTKVPKETDTAMEAELHRALRNLFDKNVPMSVEPAEELRKLAASGKYADIIRSPESGTKIYRGMRVPAGWLSGATIKKIDDIPKSGESEPGTTFTFTPRRGFTSSWTANLKSATKFANEGGPEGNDNHPTNAFAVIMEADVTDENRFNFILGDDGLYKVDPLYHFSSEHEVVAIGPVKVTKLTWGPPKKKKPASSKGIKWYLRA